MNCDDNGRVVDELLEALLAAEAQETAMTVHELSNELGWSEEKIRARLRKLKTQNKIRIVKVRREILDGREMQLPGYRMAE